MPPDAMDVLLHRLMRNSHGALFGATSAVFAGCAISGAAKQVKIGRRQKHIAYAFLNRNSDLRQIISAATILRSAVREPAID